MVGLSFVEIWLYLMSHEHGHKKSRLICAAQIEIILQTHLLIIHPFLYSIMVPSKSSRKKNIFNNLIA